MTYENAAMKWIGDTLAADATVIEQAPGEIHRGMAPQGTQRPLVTLSHRGGAPLNAAGGVGVQEVILAVAVESVDGDQDTAAETAAARIEVLLSHKRGTSDGLRFRCVPSGSLPDVPDQQEGGRYFRKQGRLWRVLVSKTS